MTGVFGGSSGRYVDVPLLDGEKVEHRQAANVLWHGANMVPGQLVLTNQRLLFQPVNYAGLDKLAKLGLPLLSGGGGAILGALISAASVFQSGHTGTVPIEQVASVGVGQQRANLLHPASLLVTMRSGQSLEIAIYTTLATLAPLPQHAVARDEMLARISQSLR